MLHLQGGDRRTECDRVEAKESVTKHEGVLGRYVCQAELGWMKANVDGEARKEGDTYICV